VTETRAPDGTFFEEEMLLGVVRGLVHESAVRIVESITRAASIFKGEAARQDDCTVVVCKVTAEDPAKQAGERPPGSAASP
jgi:serine phosphatase RsbU (regulator of sigma subunit)